MSTSLRSLRQERSARGVKIVAVVESRTHDLVVHGCTVRRAARRISNTRVAGSSLSRGAETTVEFQYCVLLHLSVCRQLIYYRPSLPTAIQAWRTCPLM